jgi:hypothetical protein
MNQVLGWARERPLFTLNDVEREFGHERKYLRLMLHRMVERGDLCGPVGGKSWGKNGGFFAIIGVPTGT